MTSLLEWLGRIGADPDDDEESRKRKALLVYLAGLILPIALVWGVLYLSLGAPAGVVAFAYFVISVASLGLFPSALLRALAKEHGARALATRVMTGLS